MKAVRVLVLASLLCLPVMTYSQDIPSEVRESIVDCADWNSAGFFEMAAVEDVTRCLDAGTDPNARDENGGTPLHVAARNNDNPAVTVALLDAGADPDARTEFGFTPLHGAAGFNADPAVTAALLDAAAARLAHPCVRAHPPARGRATSPCRRHCGLHPPPQPG